MSSGLPDLFFFSPSSLPALSSSSLSEQIQAPILSPVLDSSVLSYYPCPFTTEFLRRLENIRPHACGALQVFTSDALHDLAPGSLSKHISHPAPCCSFCCSHTGPSPVSQIPPWALSSEPCHLGFSAPSSPCCHLSARPAPRCPSVSDQVFPQLPGQS